MKIASKAGKVSAEKRQQNQGQDATSVQRPFNHTDTDTDTEKEEEGAGARGTILAQRVVVETVALITAKWTVPRLPEVIDSWEAVPRTEPITVAGAAEARTFPPQL